MTRDAHGGAHAFRSGAQRLPRLPGEFERTQALMLSVSDWQPHHRQILQEIAAKMQGHCPLVILCADITAVRQATQWLAETNEELAEVYFCPMPTNTVWLRDFGPVFLQTETAFKTLDFYYIGERPIDRTRDRSSVAAEAPRRNDRHVQHAKPAR